MQKHLLLILALFGLIAFSSADAADNSAPTSPSSTPSESPTPADEKADSLRPDAVDNMAPSKLSLFPILPHGAGPNALPQLIPISNNRALGGAHPGLTRVIIGIHDSTRNAQGLVTILQTIGGPASDKVLILAPQFLAEPDADIYYPFMPESLRKTLAYWPPDGWEDGGETRVDAPLRPISSFTVMDLILMFLGEKENFPDLKDLVIAGHGNGADFVQRYAALGMAVHLLEREGIAVHFLVANAGSYLYLTPSRPKPESMGYSTPLTGCLVYDYYKYGLQYMNAYGKLVGENAIKTRYGDRRVIYLLGESIAAADPAPDDSCAGLVQGTNRYARGASFYGYVYQLYGEGVTKRQKAYMVPKTAYNAVAMYASHCGASVLFHDGSACENPISPTVDIPKQSRSGLGP